MSDKILTDAMINQLTKERLENSFFSNPRRTTEYSVGFVVNNLPNYKHSNTISVPDVPVTMESGMIITHKTLLKPSGDMFDPYKNYSHRELTNISFPRSINNQRLGLRKRRFLATKIFLQTVRAKINRDMVRINKRLNEEFMRGYFNYE
jgi:hypothetical protein